jgi:hypothetical protein
LLAAVIAGIPAAACRFLIDGMAGQVTAAAIFLIVYGGIWLYQRKQVRA